MMLMSSSVALFLITSQSMFACVTCVCECVSQCGDSAGLVTTEGKRSGKKTTACCLL